MIIEQIVDPQLAQYAYLIGCQLTGKAIIIDPQRDIERYLDHAARLGLSIIAAADTHIHADYLSGLREFSELPNVTIYVSGEGGPDWQYEWLVGSSCSHQLLKDGDTITIGGIRLDARHTPGHTPEHLVYLVTDVPRNSQHPMGLISGDFVMVGDVGRPDLLERAAKQEGTMMQSARELYGSIQLFKELSPSIILWPGHGAGSACGKSLGAVPISSVGYELATNPSILATSDTTNFVDYIVSGQPEPPAYFARMKSVNRQGPSILGELPEPTQLPSAQIGAIVSDRSYTIIDTRPWEKYRAGHFPGALFAPLDNTFTTTIGSYINPDDRICLVIEPRHLHFAVSCLIRIGLDRVESFVTHEQMSEYINNGGTISRVAPIGMRDLLGRLSQPDILALDVRREVELIETGRVEGSYNIAHLQLLLRHAELPADKNIHVYCRTSNRSRQAVALLMKLGYSTTLVEGGIVEWQAMRYPLVTGVSANGPS